MKKFSLLTAVSTGVLGLCAAGSAHAQQMDYGALESLFGEPVTTSATGKPQRASETPVNMEIVTADDIRRTGARTIPEALKGVTGMDVWQGGINNFDVGIRGSNAYYNPTVLVMVNGRQVYMDFYGFTSWASVPVAMNEIRQIEVVKGPNTALFGFNAVAGVINIITYNPVFDKKDNVSVTAGTGTDYRGSIIKTVGVGESSGIRLSLNGMSASDFNDGHNSAAGVDVRSNDDENRAANFDGRFLIADRTTLSVGGSHSIARVNEINPSNAYGWNRYETNSVSLALTKETDDWGVIDFSGYYNTVGDEIGTTLGAGFDTVNKVAVFKLQDLFKVGTDHTFRVAGEYRNNTMETFLAGTANISYDVYSASAMWDWLILDNLSWTNAGRVDKLYLDRSGTPIASNSYSDEDYDVDLTAYSANSGLVWKVADQDTVSASYGRGIQIPSLVNFGGLDFSLLGLYIGGRPDINPTVATSYELDYTHQMPDMKFGETSVPSTFKAALYHKTFQDLISLTNSLAHPYFPGSYIYENAGESESTGLELSLKGTVSTDWRWGLNYAYETTNDTIVTNASGVPLYNTGFAKSNPRHILNVNAGWSGGPWESDVYLHYVSARNMYRDQTALVPFDSTSLSIDPVYGASARVAYKVADGVTLAINGSNLQSAKSEQTGGASVERAVWASLSWDF